jgi:hypothetical protein
MMLVLLLATALNTAEPEAEVPNVLPDSRAVRARLDRRHKSRAVFVHDALKLRPDQEAGWRRMLAALAPDHPVSADRDEAVRSFHAGLDPDQKRTFDRLVDWAKPRAGAPQ